MRLRALEFKGKLVVTFLLLGPLMGCQTTGKGDDDTRLVPASRIVFKPYTAKVPVQAGEGPYPNLFTGASYAVWGRGGDDRAAMMMETAPKSDGEAMTKSTSTGKEPMADSKAAGDSDVMSEGPPMSAQDGESKEAAPKNVQVAMADTHMAQGPHVVTCYLESEFPDMSIAYDAVGLRGIQFHLELPDGTELLPVQKNLSGELKEMQVGALKRFGRELTLYFPSRTIMVDNPAVSGAGAGVRLVLTGFDSEFFFAWNAMPDTTATTKPPRWDQEALQLTRAAYRDVKGRAKRLSHEFD